MICILKLTPEDNKTVSDNSEWKKELNVINEIRREIMQSSSGVLEEKRFTEIMETISKVRIIKLAMISDIDSNSLVKQCSINAKKIYVIR